MKPGLVAWLEAPQYPGRKIAGKVTRTAQVIDPSTRTLLTQIDVPNADASLMPGAYVKVHLKMTVAMTRLQIPVNTLLFRAEGLRVAVVDAHDVVQLKPIAIGRDFGTTVEVLQGLSESDWVVVNPSDSLLDKQPVHPQRPAGAAVKK